MNHRLYRGETDYETTLDFVKGRQEWTSLPPYWNGGQAQQGIYITLYEGDPQDHIFWFDKSEQPGAYLWLSPQEPTATYYDFNDMKWRLTVHPSFLTLPVLSQIIPFAEAELHKRNRDVPIRTFAYASDAFRIQVLEAHGYRREEVKDVYMQRPLTETASDIELPPGYTIKPATDDIYLASRELVAAGAFAGTDQPSEWGRNNVLRLWRFDRDGDNLHAVVLSPDDEVVSFIHGTFDHVTGLGELPLVATHPHHLRQGFSKALCLYTVKAMQTQGLKTAVVRTQIENFAAQATYRSVGFEVTDVLVTFVKP